MKTSAALFSGSRPGIFTRTVTAVTLASFFNYAVLARAQQPLTQKQLNDQTARQTEELSKSAERLSRRLNELDERLELQTQSMGKMAATISNPEGKAVLTKEMDEQVKRLVDLQAAAEAAGQTDLAQTIKEAAGPGGLLAQIRAIDKDTSPEKVAKILEQTKANVQKFADQANTTLDQFRKTIRSQGSGDVLRKLTARAGSELDKAAQAGGEVLQKARAHIRTYLPPDLQQKFDREPDTAKFVNNLVGQQELYPEIVLDVLQSISGKENLVASVSSALNLPPGTPLPQDVSNALKEFQNASRAHDAATGMSAAANTIMTSAIMTGNPYVIAGAAILVVLMFIFGGKGAGGGGDGEGDKGKGKGKKDNDVPVGPTPGGDSPNPNPGPTATPGSDDGPHSNVPGDFVSHGFKVVEQSDGSLVVSGGGIATPFNIPANSLKNLSAQVTVGPIGNGSQFAFSDWKSQYISSISYQPSPQDTLQINLGGANAGETVRPKFNVLGSVISADTATVVIKRQGAALAVSVENIK